MIFHFTEADFKCMRKLSPSVYFPIFLPFILCFFTTANSNTSFLSFLVIKRTIQLFIPNLQCIMYLKTNNLTKEEAELKSN